ncbi:DUF3613 domain-containing protein [Pandoraea sp. NPDC087047]|uniref:DUF3613 domain-containing protein n=1 Tax=Pandoraea sp. NPDC087047 TaxID=3364390 RepID=UPI00380D8B80
MMAVQKLQGKPGARWWHAAPLGLAMLTLWAGLAVAQGNTPVTGSMGEADARALAAPSAATLTAPTPVQVAQQSVGTSNEEQTPVAQTAAASAPAPEARMPTNVVRRTTAPRVGEPAADGMLGDETEALLAVQSNNLAAGRGLPMLGATASRAYKRYLDSFSYPIPQFYSNLVQSDSSSGSNGGGGAAPSTGTGASQ